MSSFFLAGLAKVVLLAATNSPMAGDFGSGMKYGGENNRIVGSEKGTAFQGFHTQHFGEHLPPSG